MSRFLFAWLIALAALMSAPAQGRASMDDSQARTMLVFLRSVADDSKDRKLIIDSLMRMKGTALVIAQQNVSRHVSDDEYREVLYAFAEHRPPQLSGSAPDPRAAKGTEGLLHDVLPSLEWGSRHLDLLSHRLDATRKLDLGTNARKLALANLPEPKNLDVPLFLVMGGRAGAAASENGIYFAVLAASYRDPDHYPGSAQITEFFAHELHHVGLGEILDREQDELHLSGANRCAFDLLRGLVMEGSASYLINGHRNLAAMRQDRMLAATATISRD